MSTIVCTKCVMETNGDPDISFDKLGVCNYCNTYQENKIKLSNFISNRESNLEKLIQLIKSSKKGKYDCVIGVSGGGDSSYVAYLTKKWGLNPLAVHLDNGWNTQLSEENVINVTNSLGIDLKNVIIDWEEFKDVQRAYFKASVVDIEMPTDHAVTAILMKVAAENDIKFVLSGESTFTEGLIPPSWNHNKSDYLNIKTIHGKYGQIKKLKTIPYLTFINRWFLTKVKGIKIVKALDYVDYHKDETKKLLINELGWQDYGAKHNESIFTRFYQYYILPKKFNIDKRKAHLSNLIRANQMTREEALKELETDHMSPEDLENDKKLLLNRLEFSNEEFDKIMKHPRVEHTRFKSIMNYYKMRSKLKKKLLGKK